MTAFYTMLGVVAYLVGLGLSLDVLTDSPGSYAVPYLTVLAALTIAALVVGGWWFVAGTGEERLAVPTLLAGIWGMNFENMPELTWTVGYPLALAVMALIVISLYRLFKKSGWL